MFETKIILKNSISKKQQTTFSRKNKMKANSMDKSKSKNPNPLVKLLGKCIAPDFFILFYDIHNKYFFSFNFLINILKTLISKT